MPLNIFIICFISVNRAVNVVVIIERMIIYLAAHTCSAPSVGILNANRTYNICPFCACEVAPLIKFV